MKEIWKDVPGYEGRYQASSMGQIRSVSRTIVVSGGKHKGVSRDFRGRVLRASPNSNGYLQVSLSTNSKLKPFRVHRLVLLSFFGFNKKKPHGNHKNGIKTDNAVENLEWVTCKQNIRHAHRTGLADFCVPVRRNDGVLYPSLKAAAKAIGVFPQNIWGHLNGQRDKLKLKGFTFVYERTSK